MILLQFLYLLSLSVWVGSMVFFSLIAAPSIFKAFPKETAGEIVAKIFPKYYQVGCLCSVLSLGTLAMSSVVFEWHRARLITLSFMMLSTFYAAFIVVPKVRQLKNDLRASTDCSDEAEKSKRFRRFHGFSMLLNLVVLLAGLLVIFFTVLDMQVS